VIEISERTSQYAVIAEVASKHNFDLKKCRSVSKLSTIKYGDADTFGITSDGDLYLKSNSSLNSTKQRDYTVTISLEEKWKSMEDETYFGIWQTACVMICVCPGESTACLPSSSPDTTLPTPTSDDSLLSTAVTTESSVTTPSSTTEVITLAPIRKRPTKRSKWFGQDWDQVPGHSHEHARSELDMAIVLCTVGLGTAVMVILLLVCILYMKSKRYPIGNSEGVTKLTILFVCVWYRKLLKEENRSKSIKSLNDIEMSQRKDKVPCNEPAPAEPPPDSELFYCYYSDLEGSHDDEPGVVSSNRREQQHQDILNQDGRLHDQIGSSSRSGDKTAEWVDEQRRIIEKRTSMPTALDDVSVEDCAESLSLKSHPSLYRVRVDLIRDGNFVLTNPLVKLVPRALHRSPTRLSQASSTLGDRASTQLHNVEDMS
jgi:hypothetical protein